MLIDGTVVRSSNVQFYVSQITSIAPVAVHQHVSLAVPMPELSTSKLAANDDAVFDDVWILSEIDAGIDLQNVEPVQPLELVERLVQIKDVPLVDNVVQEPLLDHVQPQDLTQTHTGRAKRNAYSGWLAAHISGYEPALTATADLSSRSFSSCQKQRKPGWGTSQGMNHLLDM